MADLDYYRCQCVKLQEADNKGISGKLLKQFWEENEASKTETKQFYIHELSSVWHINAVGQSWSMGVVRLKFGGGWQVIMSSPAHDLA